MEIDFELIKKNIESSNSYTIKFQFTNNQNGINNY